jgi:hypothetical protein
MAKWNYDLVKMPKRPDVRFLGLWWVNDVPHVRIIYRARRSQDGFDYLAENHGGGDFFVAPPEAFCPIPRPRKPGTPDER